MGGLFGGAANPVSPCGGPVGFAAFGAGLGVPVVDEFFVFGFEVHVGVVGAHLRDDFGWWHPVVREP